MFQAACESQVYHRPSQQAPLCLAIPRAAVLKEPSPDRSGTLPGGSLGSPQLSLGVIGQVPVAAQPVGCPRLRAPHTIAGVALRSREARAQQGGTALPGEPHRKGHSPHWGPGQGSAVRNRGQAPPRLIEGRYQWLPRPLVAPRLCHSGAPAVPSCSVPDCSAAQPRPPRIQRGKRMQ